MILSSKFVNSGEQLYINADKIKPEPDFDDIVCHGSPNSLIINGIDNEEWHYSAKESAEMIRNSAEFKGRAIRLIACQAGAKNDGLAQQIADILGVPVKAPTTLVYVNYEGEVFFTNNKIIASM